MKILVRTPNWIGDVVLALPLVEALKANDPGAEIWIAASSPAGEIFSEGEFASRTIPMGPLGRLRDLRRTSRDLKRRGFQRGVLLTNSFSSALLFAMAGIPERWGYRGDGRDVFLTRSVSRRAADPPPHMVHYYLRLAEGLGLSVPAPEIRLSVTSREKDSARRALASLGIDPKRPLVILNPGAAYGPAKRWPAPRFAELARLLEDRSAAQIIVTGGSEDVAIVDEIGTLLSHQPPSLAGKTSLRELLGLISLASVFITNDTGPMHLANALRVPVVAIFGPTDPRVTAPFHQPAAVVKREGVACWPCFYRKCPFDHRCLAGISAEEVFRAASPYLR